MKTKIATWEPCDIEFKGLLIEPNFVTKESMIRGLVNNEHASILYISTNDGLSPTAQQGFNLNETIILRDYLNELIKIAEDAINNK